MQCGARKHGSLRLGVLSVIILPHSSSDLVVRWILLYYIFFLEFSVGVRAFVIGRNQISFFLFRWCGLP